MNTRVARLAPLVALAFWLVALPRPTRAQAIFTDDKRAVLAQLNAFRAANDAAPLAYDARLDDAAQRHANDMAARGFVDITGSDGTDTLRRMTAANVPAYDGQRPHVESVYAGQGGFEVALRFLSEDDSQRASMLSGRFRHVGIGIASDGVRTYWSLVYGAVPGAFPFAINDGTSTTRALEVTLRLSQEDAVQSGTADAPGRIVDVRVSESPEFEKAGWQPWQPKLPFVLARRAISTTRTVNVEFRDARGLTARSQAAIVLDLNSQTLPSEPTPSPQTTRIAAPAATRAPLATATTAPQPTTGPRPTSTAVPVGPLSIGSEPAAPPVTASPSPQVIADAPLAPAAPVTDNLSQSRVISDVPSAPAQPALFQPRDRDTLPAWVWIAFACAQLAAIVYVIRRIFRK
jgi:uncharacterized protein YkwD